MNKKLDCIEIVSKFKDGIAIAIFENNEKRGQVLIDENRKILTPIYDKISDYNIYDEKGDRFYLGWNGDISSLSSNYTLVNLRNNKVIVKSPHIEILFNKYIKVGAFYSNKDIYDFQGNSLFGKSKYNTIEFIEPNLFIVSKEDSLILYKGIVNDKNEFIIPKKYTDIHPISNNAFSCIRFMDNQIDVINIKTNKTYTFNNNNKQIIYIDNKIIYENKTGIHVIDENGESHDELLKDYTDYDDIIYYNNDGQTKIFLSIRDKKTRLLGVLNEHLKLVIPCKYYIIDTDIDDDENIVVARYINDKLKYGIINISGDTILPCTMNYLKLIDLN